MNDVTEFLHTYRECARGVWNNFLRADADFNRIDAFTVICEDLLNELVLHRLGKGQYRRITGTCLPRQSWSAIGIGGGSLEQFQPSVPLAACALGDVVAIARRKWRRLTNGQRRLPHSA